MLLSEFALVILWDETRLSLFSTRGMKLHDFCKMLVCAVRPGQVFCGVRPVGLNVIYCLGRADFCQGALLPGCELITYGSLAKGERKLFVTLLDG